MRDLKHRTGGQRDDPSGRGGDLRKLTRRGFLCAAAAAGALAAGCIGLAGIDKPLYKSHLTSVALVGFSSSGANVVSWGREYKVKTWDTQSGNLIKTVELPGTFYAFAHSRDMTRMAAAEKTIVISDVGTGDEIKTLTWKVGSIEDLAFSSDGQKIASSGEDRTVRIWDISTGKIEKTLTGHTDEIWSLAYSPDGSSIASGSLDGKVMIWDATTGELSRTIEMKGLVDQLAYSPDSSTIAAVYGQIVLLDAATGEVLGELTGNEWLVNCLAFSPDGKTLASGHQDNKIKLWDPATCKLLRTIGTAEDIETLEYSPDGKLIVSGDVHGIVSLWKAEDGSHIRDFADSAIHN